ncbi:MAG: pyridoxine 5'-phosphate synthase [Candidatus Kapabacteria bacterium]|nr:pyridoxine 5'-phosphate synthase [Ignavibacteriota bacterium]MCW5884319.1 pyridoxine 5'-phosphate synthase [Candidatus Kapabacteria bacterium]
MPRLNINIDHIATLRQARLGTEPDPVFAAQIAMLAGADGIVAHLREDRRHVNDRDVRLIREIVDTRFDLEMAATEEIIKIALEIKPDLVTIVPEKRTELTTEGGLNLAENIEKYTELCERMHEKNIIVSFFIEPDTKQIEAAEECGADMVELHTGVYANNYRNIDLMVLELDRIAHAAQYANDNMLEVAAGHGLNYYNIKDMLGIGEIQEYSIGHSIISRAAYVGLDKAVREMIEIINRGLV